MGEHGIKWESKSLLDLDYTDDLSILDENLSKINKFLEALRAQCARIDLKIKVNKTQSLRLGISEGDVG